MLLNIFVPFSMSVQRFPMQELEVCRSEASARLDEVRTVKRENRKRRKIIEAYQDMLSHGATGLHPVREKDVLVFWCALRV